MPNPGHLLPTGYHRSALVMSLAGGGSIAPLDIGGDDYAFKKLKRWKAEGPTERNKKMAQFLLNHRASDPYWSHGLHPHLLLLIELALEWNYSAIWEEVLKKSVREGRTPEISLDMLIRGWELFTFDRTKSMLVYSIFASISVTLLTFPLIRCALQNQ